MCQALSHLRAFTHALPCLAYSFPRPPRVHMGVRSVQAHRAPCLEGPCAWFNVLPLPSWNSEHPWTRGPTFSFCAGPHKLHSWACRHGCLLPCFLQIFIWVSSLQRGLFWIPRLKLQPQPQPGSLAPFLAVFSSRVCLFLSYCTFDYSVCYLPSMKARVFVCLVHSCIPPVVLKVPGTEPCPVSICWMDEWINIMENGLGSIKGSIWRATGLAVGVVQARTNEQETNYWASVSSSLKWAP